MKKIIKGCLGCFGIMFGSILVLFLAIYVYSEYFYEEWPTKRIERITGVRVPEFKITEYRQGERHFTGDHMDTLMIEFEEVPSNELFLEIDKMIETGKTEWEKEGETYSFSTFWGNGYPTPEGESEGADGIFGMTIIKGDRNGEILSGSW